MGRTLKDKARTGRPEHERTWTPHFNVEEAEDRERWDWLRTLPGGARQYLVKEDLPIHVGFILLDEAVV